MAPGNGGLTTSRDRGRHMASHTAPAHGNGPDLFGWPGKPQTPAAELKLLIETRRLVSVLPVCRRLPVMSTAESPGDRQPLCEEGTSRAPGNGNPLRPRIAMRRSHTRIDTAEPRQREELEVVSSPSDNEIGPRQRGVNGKNCPLLGGKTGRDKHGTRAHMAGKRGGSPRLPDTCCEVRHTPVCHRVAARRPLSSLTSAARGNEPHLFGCPSVATDPSSRT